ncbi:TetR/AcrR family transcriptional regulator [Acidiferrimicrobium sp. IK]|uniref:TetR/AcrR family transcriptional regulator n=1 Tax=Acidiferrimicrobium sp. IK TaxID=2871700 RepID=UPI0021CAEDEB|nr:TetR/AcrR family transcriptional regulator [Acidiferrimicrobium sp. IK]MCU4183975.1 TetR/AcrR family transcriptional regulator [Acidiferrimicrobium sp. IK]
MTVDPGLEPGANATQLSRREQTKQTNRSRIYDAALELFAERGYSAVTVEDICARADVGRATFFRLYGTKSGLLEEFNLRLAGEARSRVERLASPSTAEALREVQLTISDAWSSSGAGLREMAEEYIHTVSLAAGAGASQPELHVLVSSIIRTGQTRGEVVAKPNPDFIAWVVIAALCSATATWLGTPETMRRRSTETLQLLFTGMLAEG